MDSAGAGAPLPAAPAGAGHERGAATLRAFLLITAGSVAAFAVGVVLHNLVYALLGVEEAVFFLLAVVVAPIAFAVGVVGTVFLLVRRLLARM